MKRGWIVTAVLLLAAPVASAAPRQPTAEEVERARMFFGAGAQAYEVARYADAVRAFEQAYDLAPRPNVVFSLAQAERKEFFASNDPRMLRRAIQHYKEYLDQVPSGGRRAEAIEAKADLEGRLARLDPSQASTSAAMAERRKARLTVYSATPGARVSVDGAAPQEQPYFGDIEPGRHRVRVSAEGHFDEEREVSGDRPIDIPMNLPLREKPAMVTVALDAAADVYVDGRIVATTPLDRPIEVPPGIRVLSIARNGKKPYSQEVTLVRGRPFRFEPRLETSGQRVVASTMFLGAGASAIVCGVTALVAVGKESSAKDIDEARRAGTITTQDLDRYNALIDDRDGLATASLVSGAIGAGLLVGGALLYVFDKPNVAVLPPRSVEPTPAPKKPDSLEMGAAPLLGPGLVGAAFSARF